MPARTHPHPLLPLCCWLALCWPATSTRAAPPQAEEATLPETRVTAAPLPAPQRSTLRINGQDADDDPAEQLRQVNGVRVMRQAGTAGVISVNGLSGSRVPVLLDGLSIDGACNHGMDPATSYLSLDALDRLTVLKGPSTVRHAGVLGGAVLAERRLPRADEPNGLELQAQVGRFEEQVLVAEALLNTPEAWARVNSRRSQRDDFRDGDGKGVPSRFSRRQDAADFGWRLHEQHTLQLDAAHSNGQAMYPAFHMDGTAFRQDRIGGGWTARDLAAWLPQLQLRVQEQRIHHEMDNFTLRGQAGTVIDADNRLSEEMRQQVARRQARLEAVITPADGQRLSLGAEWHRDEHDAANRLRTSSCVDIGQPQPFCVSVDPGWRPYYQVEQHRRSAFAEWELQLGEWLLTAGTWRDAVRSRTGAIRNFTTGLQPKSGERGRTDVELAQHVARAEWAFAPDWRTHLAWGQSQRAPDPIEIGSVDALRLQPETNREVHAGLEGRVQNWRLTASTFVSRIGDFILLTSGTTAANVQARRRGLETELSGQWGPWQAGAAFSRLRADNLTERRPLAQTPPDELRLNLGWQSGVWQWRADWRGVSRQDRFAFNQGNTNGLDVNSATPGFSVLDVSARWQWHPSSSLTVGVDNVFDRAYAEHINHSFDRSWSTLGTAVSTRVMEPGQRWWIKWLARY